MGYHRSASQSKTCFTVRANGNDASVIAEKDARNEFDRIIAFNICTLKIVCKNDNKIPSGQSPGVPMYLCIV